MLHPKTLGLSTLTAAALMIGAATELSAADHRIRLVDGGFFPEITYMLPGETVTFVNEMSQSETVKASDDSWTTGALPQHASATLPVSFATQLEFHFVSNTEKTGKMTFDFKPIEEAEASTSTDNSTDAPSEVVQ